MIYAAVILMVMGAGIFLLGRRGFLLGTHPFCAACQYDLHMLPLETARCPECGAAILEDHAIRVGHRRPSREGMFLGAVIILTGIMCGVSRVPQWWAHLDGSPFKPLSWLEREMTSPDAGIRGKAGAELSQRLRRGTLSAQDVNRLAEHILQLQADHTVSWNRGWGDIVEIAHGLQPRDRGSLLSDKLWERYITQSMQLQARVRPRVRAGDPVPIMVTCEVKGSNRIEPDLIYKPEVTAVAGGRPISLRGEPRKQQFFSVLEWNLLWMPEGALARGSQTLDLLVSVTAQDHAIQATAKRQIALPLEVIDAADSAVTLKPPTDAKIRAEFEAGIRWRLRESAGVIPLPDSTTLGKIWMTSLPITGSFRIVLRQGEREWRLARCMVRPEDAATVSLVMPAFDPSNAPHAGAAEIVCIPDPEIAAGTADVMEIWGGEMRRAIVFGP